MGISSPGSSESSLKLDYEVYTTFAINILQSNTSPEYSIDGLLMNRIVPGQLNGCSLLSLYLQCKKKISDTIPTVAFSGNPSSHDDNSMMLALKEYSSLVEDLCAWAEVANTLYNSLKLEYALMVGLRLKFLILPRIVNLQSFVNKFQNNMIYDNIDKAIRLLDDHCEYCHQRLLLLLAEASAEAQVHFSGAHFASEFIVRVG